MLIHKRLRFKYLTLPIAEWTRLYYRYRYRLRHGGHGKFVGRYPVGIMM
jgi:hypothetical protein